MSKSARRKYVMDKRYVVRNIGFVELMQHVLHKLNKLNLWVYSARVYVREIVREKVNRQI